MTRTVAVAHYCEGAGHASRLLGVAAALEVRELSVAIAGGGPGQRFVELNGYDEPDLPTVEFVRGFQRPDYAALLWRTPRAAIGRLRGFRRWLRAVEPDALVSDDPFATAAAANLDGPRFHVAHDPPAFYDSRLERGGAHLRAWLPRRLGATLVQPTIWEGPPRLDDAVVVGPIAHEGAGEAPEVDDLLVPSDFSTETSAIEATLRGAGRSVTVVGDEEWTPVASLYPHVDRAEVVVCSGYSTAMEAAVAGTPCVLVPATSEQRGVARALASVRGFRRAANPSMVPACIESVEVPTPRANGAERVGDLVVDALG
ncbi:MAG: hypothetical protein ACLFM8_04410 [Halobacteriales archaeon]